MIQPWASRAARRAARMCGPASASGPDSRISLVSLGVTSDSPGPLFTPERKVMMKASRQTQILSRASFEFKLTGRSTDFLKKLQNKPHVQVSSSHSLHGRYESTSTEDQGHPGEDVTVKW